MGELAPGTVFAAHRIEAVAGRGGMGVVYRARHLGLDRTVALKLIAPAMVDDAPTRQRFLLESKLAASIDHPNVIPIYYTGEEEGIAYIAMRYVEGRDLRSLARATGGLAPARAAWVVSQVAGALDAAHAAGLLHRDVKPANVLLAAGDHAYLSDFGLSKHARSAGGETSPGHWVGTLDYVAPEQIRGEILDARGDVYALGCVLYFALTGCAPFPREGDEAKLWAHLAEPPPAARDRIADLPCDLDDVIGRALAKRPADRYPSAGDLGRAAVAAAGAEEVRTPERVVAPGSAAPGETPTMSASGPAGMARAGPTEPHRAARRSRPPPAAVGAALAALAAAAGLAVVLGTRDDSPPPPPFRPHVDAVLEVGGRPNGIAVGNGTVFATRYDGKRVTLVDERTARLRSRRPTVGVGARAVAVGFGAAWVAVSRERALVELDAVTGRPRGRVALPISPQTVAVGHGAVWAGLSTLEPAGAPDVLHRVDSRTLGVPDVLARIDPRTLRVVGRYRIPDGIRALVATPTGIWVVHRYKPAVSRFDPAARKLTRRVSIGAGPENRLGQAAYGAGAVWVTSTSEDTVSRIDDTTGRKITSGVTRSPEGIAARGRQIWVTSFVDHTITRIAADTSRPLGAPIRVRLNPYALAVTRDSVWVTAVGRGQIVRVRTR